MNRAPRASKSSALVKHKWPMAAQLVWEIYTKPGMTQRQLSTAMGIQYFTGNKRFARLVRRCGGLIESYKGINRLLRYRPAVDISANQARAWVKQSKKGELYASA